MHAETEALVRSIDIVNERVGGLEGRLSELERLLRYARPGMPMALNAPELADVVVIDEAHHFRNPLARSEKVQIEDNVPTKGSFGTPVMEQVDPDLGLTPLEAQAALNEMVSADIDHERRERARMGRELDRNIMGTREGNAKGGVFPTVSVSTGSKEVVGSVTLPLPCCGGEDQKRAVLLEAVHVAVRELHTKLVNEANEILRRQERKERRL
jgi:hypothetical protein